MTPAVAPLVIDASIGVKWVVEEPGTPQALALRHRARLFAPDLWAAECANVLWKKVARGELTQPEALAAAQLLQAAEVELLPTRALLAPSLRLALRLGHPAYDCLYLALAIQRRCPLVTADRRFAARVRRHPELASRVIDLAALPT